MTILNISARPDRVVFVTDTIGAGDGIPAGLEVSKILPLVHADMIFAGRGYADMLWAVWSSFYRCPLPLSIDVVAEHMPAMMRTAQTVLYGEGRLSRNTMFEGLGDLQLFVAGRSRQAGTFRVLHWELDAFGQIAGHVEVGNAFAPIDGVALPAALPDSDAEWMILARRQLKVFRSAHPGVHIGGSLIVAELSDRGLQVRNVGRI